MRTREELRRPVWLFSLSVAMAVALPAQAQEPPPGAESPKPSSEAPKQAAPPQVPPKTALDFDLLEPPKPGLLQVDESALRRRRTLLNWHQGVGLGMFGIALANTVVGQLNYSDRFANGPSTGKYELAHTITAGATVAAFAATGLLAVFAPNPIPKTGGFDRMTVHKIAMATATAGIAAEAVLGLYTASREGYLNQPNYAAAHLAIGYATFAAIALGVGVIVF
jgi:hypothetical protein